MGLPTALTEALVSWARAAPDVRAVCVVGSHARGTAMPDSDVDLVVVVDDVSSRLHSREWLSCVGQFTSVDHEGWGLVQSLRARYSDGLEVEFGLAPLAWATPPIDAKTAAVIREGLVAVWDPDGLLDVAVQEAARNDDGVDGR